MSAATRAVESADSNVRMMFERAKRNVHPIPAIDCILAAHEGVFLVSDGEAPELTAYRKIANPFYCKELDRIMVQVGADVFEPYQPDKTHLSVVFRWSKSWPKERIKKVIDTVLDNAD